MTSPFTTFNPTVPTQPMTLPPRVPVPSPRVPPQPVVLPSRIPVPSPRVPTQPVVLPPRVPSPRVPTQPVVLPPRVPSPRVPTQQTILSPRVPSPRVPSQPVVLAPRVPIVPTQLTILTPRGPVPSPRIPTQLTILTPRGPVPSPRIPTQQTILAPRVPSPQRAPIPRVTLTLVTKKAPPADDIDFTPEMIDDDTVIGIANKLDEVNFARLLEFLGDYYHNDEGLISDERYDEVIAIYEAKYGRYNVVGAEPRGEMVNLPFYLSSLRKIKEEAELATWLRNYPGPYIIQDKMDGVTLLIYSRIVNGRRVTSAYTRGGGVKGKDVSHILPYIKVPNLNQDIAIRGELVMEKEAFIRAGAGYKNSRNIVSGVIGAKERFNPDLVKEFTFYAYRIITKNNSAEEDINELRALGFNVPNPVSSPTLTREMLENYFRSRQREAPYEVDGLVIYQNRSGVYPDNDEPRHVVAFKTTGETAITTVRDVVWRGSKDRKLKPRVYYDVTPLSGADLNYASGYNARYIVNNGIGPGAKILLTRSGDVIPKILSVLEPSPSGALLPDPQIHGKYEWNDNGVEFVLTGNNKDVRVSQLKHFLTTLGVKNAGRKRIESLVEARIETIDQLLRVTPQQLATIPGIGSTLSNQLHQDMHAAVKNVNLARIMDASGIFPNIGERRFQAIIDVYPNILDFVNVNNGVALIQQVKGFNTLAVDVMQNLPIFVEWLRENPMITLERKDNFLVIDQPTTGNNLQGQTFVFSGFRDKDMEDLIRRKGGKVTGAVSGNTTMVIMKDLSPANMKGKAQEAQNKGIPLISKDEFLKRYL